MPLGMIIVLALILAWILHAVAGDKDPHGDVELGDPTVTGDSVIAGTDVYYSRRGPSIELTPDNPAVDPLMRQLIFESSSRIAADDDEEQRGD